MNLETDLRHSIHSMPRTEGPIRTTPDSYPFCAMNHSREPLDLAVYGYLEEEYFLSGTANVYDSDAKDHLVINEAGLPYKNRILVRRPADPRKFSGRVYMDILNATQGYDIEDQWHRDYLWCMEHGHAYVGVTSKPVNVLSLKNFDYDRYGDLDWSGSAKVPSPTLSCSATIPGTEEGLIWDILSQTAMKLRYGGSENCLGGFRVQYLYLTGQSQSGAYLNTYLSYFDPYLRGPDGRKLFDGYLNIVGSLVQRSLRQSDSVGPLKLYQRHMHACSTPYICISSEADLTLFNQFLPGVDLLGIRIENSDTQQDKCRYYEFAGAPHTDIVCPILSGITDIEKTGRTLPNLNPKLLDGINDFPLDMYVCGMLEKLHLWAASGVAPEMMPPLERSRGTLRRDAFGNALGGFRTPFVEVPIASYVASNPDDPEGICGKMTYFSAEQVRKLYGTPARYLELFRRAVKTQVDTGWISAENGENMCEWSLRASGKLD